MKKISTLILVLAMALTACGGSGEPQVALSAAITSPADGTELQLGAPIVITGKVTGGGVKSVLVLGDGATLATISNATAPGEYAISQNWATQQSGAHVVQLRGLNDKGDTLISTEAFFKIKAPPPTAAPIATATPVTPTPLPAALVTPTPKASPTLTVTNDFANVRQGPDATTTLVGRFDKGQTATVLGKNEDGKWWFIQWAGNPGKGWVLGELVQVSGDAASIPALKADGTPVGGAATPAAATTSAAPTAVAPTAAPTSAPTLAPTIAPTAASGAQIVVTNAFVNVRTGPGTGYTQVGQLTQNQTVPVKGKSADGQWWQVSFQSGPGGLGWVVGTFVRFEGDAASVPVVQIAPPVSNTSTPTTTGNTGGAVFVALVNVPTNSVADGKAKDVLLALYNEARAEAKLPLLKYSSVLEKSAQGHADDLAKTGVGSHTGSDGSDPRARMTRVGYAGRYTAENWAWARSAEQAFDMWFNQEFPDGVHRRTILSPNYTEVGLGIAQSRGGYFFIANFGG